VSFDPSMIISSGLGCSLLKSYRSLIESRRVFVYGTTGSGTYVSKAGGILVDEPELAECIVMASSLPHENHRLYKSVFDVLSKNLAIDVVCINPDHYVLYNDEFMPVMGFYAHQMSIQLGRQFHWVGKPYSSFSDIVRSVFLERKLSCQSLVFCDDNPFNVAQMAQDLDCRGCVITATGVYSRYDYFCSDDPKISSILNCKI